MSDYTSKLNLYKVDPAIDGEDTFNIKSMMNDNWDKIDEKVGNMDEKLSGVEDNANNYNHPDTHDADMIRIQDEGGKFTGDNVEDALGEVGSQLGDIANEVTENENKIGNLLTLQTIEKNTLVGAMNEVFQNADNGKTAIYNAIVGKGTTPSSQDFSDLVSAISSINTGKKWASGQINVKFQKGLMFTYSINLPIVPSLVVLLLDTYNTNYEDCHISASVKNALSSFNYGSNHFDTDHAGVDGFLYISGKDIVGSMFYYFAGCEGADDGNEYYRNIVWYAIE